MAKNYTSTMISFLLFLFLNFSCNGPSEKNGDSASRGTFGSFDCTYPKHAKGFRVKYFSEHKIVELLDVHDSSKVLMRYYLVKRGEKHVAGIPSDSLVYVPVRRAAILDLTQINFLDALREMPSICAVAGLKYVSNKKMKSKFLTEQLLDIDRLESFKVGKLISTEPEIVVTSEIENKKYEAIKEAGIKIVQTGDYLESTPLARAEWIKFISYFYNSEKLADGLFNAIESRYLSLAEGAKKIKRRPTVFSAEKEEDLWYVEGGNSYFSSLYADAGADYLWADTKSSAPIAVVFDKICAKAAEADYIRVNINHKIAFTVSELLKAQPEYQLFKAVVNKQVISCNSHDYPCFEDGILQPDIILADLIKIFHPELSTNHKSVFYGLIQ